MGESIPPASPTDALTDGSRVTTSIKRVLLGPPIPTRRLSETLLPKTLALPVFSSDALSSVAYATEQILIVLLAASAAAAHFALPIALAVSVLMAIVVTSYRQTVRGYPHGGGAYIVARHNLGTVAGLVAAAALMTDYVLTVTVSVAAGAFAVTSAIPGSAPWRLELSLGFVALMTVANLRGLRESGILFAVPTYAFIASIFVMSGVGLVRCLDGCPLATVPSPIASGGGAVGLFVVLHAFSSGSTALTGVEAISNGVPAFRPPSARNAETVLATMAAIAIAMFLSISWLAVHVGARPSHQLSVVAQIARAVLGPGIGFYAVQVTTAGILIVAANTAFQDFPRLGSILARDRFLPRAFQNRGDRLVFSNGIIVLAFVASALLVTFDANVSRLIQLYVVGVFVAFTLSQSGMVMHWRRSRDAGRRRRMAINGVGGAATGVVLVVITVTKFVEGAWIVVLAIPIFVWAFLRTRGRIESTRSLLTRGVVPRTATGGSRCVLLVDDVGPSAVAAGRYLHALQPDHVDALYVGSDEHADVLRSWESAAPTDVRLHVVDRSPTHLAASLSTLVQSEGFLTVGVPGLHLERRRWLGASAIARLAHALSADTRMVLSQTPLIAGTHEAAPDRVVALILAAEAADPEAQAVKYAHSMQAAEIRALHIALDPEGEQDHIQDEWTRRGFDAPLQVVDAPLRTLGPPLIQEARRVTTDADTLLQIIVPIVVGPHRRSPLGHRHASYVEGLFLHTERVMVSHVHFVVPGAR